MSKNKSEKEIPHQLPKMSTGFVVAISEEGRVFLERNPESMAFEVDREASMIEVRRYLSEILMDLQAQAAAEYTIGAIMAAQPQPEAQPE